MKTRAKGKVATSPTATHFTHLTHLTPNPNTSGSIFTLLVAICIPRSIRLLLSDRALACVRCLLLASSSSSLSSFSSFSSYRVYSFALAFKSRNFVAKIFEHKVALFRVVELKGRLTANIRYNVISCRSVVPFVYMSDIVHIHKTQTFRCVAESSTIPVLSSVYNVANLPSK